VTSSPITPSILQRSWKSLTSVRLALILLLVLALAALVGTILPQDRVYGFYVERFGPQFAWFIDRLGLDRVYRSPWFLALITLLVINLVACSLDRIPQALRRLRHPLDPERYLALPERGRVHWPARMQEAPSVLEHDCNAILGPGPRLEQGETVWLLRSRGRVGVLGPYIIHLSIILIILGGMVGKLWGVRGHLHLVEGQTGGALEVEGREAELPLDFAVRLDRFQVEFYPDGPPSEYRSDLSFLRDGREVEKTVCRVNHPVEFGGFTFYQSTYQTALGGPVRLEVDHQGHKTAVEAAPRQRVMLPDGNGAIMVVRADGNLQGRGPAVQIAYLTGRGHPLIFWVFQNQPPEGDQQPGPHRFRLAGLDFRFTSGLLVKRDPGVGWVYAGFILLLPGFWLAFFTPRQRWAVSLQPDGKKGWRLTLHGAGDRHREAFSHRLERLTAKLEERA